MTIDGAEFHFLLQFLFFYGGYLMFAIQFIAKLDKAK